jgi:hypothetical protein
VKCALDRVANATRRMDVRRVDHDPLHVILDADDPVERMLFLLRLLLVARQTDHLLFVLPGEIAPQRHDTGREFVLDATAGRAQLLNNTLNPRRPLPAPLLINGAALRAGRPVMQLLPRLVGSRI